MRAVCAGTVTSVWGDRRLRRRNRLALGLHERGLVAHLAREVARREVREREQPYAGLLRQCGGLPGGGVRGLARPRTLLVEERRLVHGQIGAVRVDLGRLVRAGVARDHDPAAGARRPENLLGPDAGDLLPALEPPELGPLGHPERPRGRGVEATGPVVLDERVAVGADAMVDRKRRDDVAPAPNLVVRLELDQLQ